MDQRIQKLASWNPPTQQINTQLTPRAKAAPNASRPLQEKEGFEQDGYEVARLQLKEKIGGITSVEQQQLGVLQAKMNDSWLQRREKLSRFGHNIANIPISSPDKQGSKPVQPKLAIKELASQKLSDLASKKEMGSVQKAFRTMPAPQMLPMPTLQAKFTIGEPGDKYEQEADSVAVKVVNQIHSPQFQQQGQIVQRQEEQEEELQTKPSNDVLQKSPLLPEIQLETMPEEDEIQRKPINDGKGWKDDKTDVELMPIKQEGDMPEAQRDKWKDVEDNMEYADYYLVVSEQVVVMWEESEKSYYDLEGNTWRPGPSGYDYTKVSHYNCTSFDEILEMKNVKAEDMGNVQKDKLATLREGIEKGSDIPAVSVNKETKELINGKNRYIVSQEYGYTEIPVKYVE